MAPGKRQLVFYLAIILGTLVYTGAPAYLLPSATSSYVSSSYAQKLLSIGPQVGFHVPAENLPLAPPPILPTTLLSADAGYHAFGSLYLKNGTIFLLSPPGARAYNDKKGGGGGFRDILGRELETLGRITSTGRMSATDMAYRVPTEEDIQILAWKDRGVLELEEKQPLRIEGTTFLFNDPGEEFLNHFYHFWAELVIGAWRSLTVATDDAFPSDPRRFMFPHADEDQWRDRPGINSYLLKQIFPSLAYEHRSDWIERAATGRTFLLDKVVLVDRTAGGLGDKCSGGPGQEYFKMNANVMTNGARPNWSQSLRHRLLAALPSVPVPKVPVITYISRQNGGRSLRDADHQGLVQALKELTRRNGWILEIPIMEKMSRDDQFALSLRTTVMVGVHGNGLTHQIWMEPSPFSTVIEIFINKGFNYDYAIISQAYTHRHYGIWSDGVQGTVVDTINERPLVNFPEDFHGYDIRVDGPTVAALIEERLRDWKP